MPYKYVVAVDSKGFNEAPAPIINAVKRLEIAAKASIRYGSFTSFNELLAVGYFEEGKMGVSRFLRCKNPLSILNFPSSSMTMAKRNLGQLSPPFR